ncbi:MAG: Rrf2 family transcriptional regulator [Bacteroidales bacterium]|nr:Rrf2 family transcriptional regulator [Bacteroidales bacterium]
MFISKTSEYALRILTYMALNSETQLSATILFEELRIPKRYLMRLLTDLSKSGFIQATRGRSGGYVFAKPLESIYFSEIIDSVEGLLSYEGCVLGNPVCPIDKPCAMHHIWDKPKLTFLKTLKTTTLADLKEADNI